MLTSAKQTTSTDEPYNHGINWNANKDNYHPGIVRLQELGERLLTRYLCGDVNENMIVPTFTEIEAIRNSYEAMVTTYNHQLQEV